MLYFRMLFALFVSFYSSRVVLEILGVDDYGLYNVVGGIVAMLAFLNGSMSGATSRFITYELGKGNYEAVEKTFSAALTVHIIIAVILFIGAETIGLWFLENKLNIRPERMFAARAVYQCSIISAVIAITQIPYNASIIANEKMDIYASVGIYEVLAKLGILFLLKIFDYDQLIIYAILLLLVSTSVALIYRIYCIRNLKGCKYRISFDKTCLKPMLLFSGWDLYGNMCVVFRNQGLNLLLNLFFGTALNASYSISQQVNSGVSMLASNFLTAVKPNITKLYAKEDYSKLFSFYKEVSKGSYLLLLVIISPFFFEAPYVISLWLTTVPDYTIYFVRVMLIAVLIDNISASLLTTVIHASGNIKKLSFIRGTIYILSIPISYFILHIQNSPIIIIYVNLVVTLLAGIYTLYLGKTHFNFFSIRLYLVDIFIPLSAITCLSFSLSFLMTLCKEESFYRVLFNGMLSAIFISIYSFFFLIPKGLKNRILIKISDVIAVQIRLTWKKVNK